MTQDKHVLTQKKIAVDLKSNLAALKGLLEKEVLSPEEKSEFFKNLHTYSGTCLLFSYHEIAKLSQLLEKKFELVLQNNISFADFKNNTFSKAFESLAEFSENYIFSYSEEFKQKVLTMSENLKNNNSVPSATPQSSQSSQSSSSVANKSDIIVQSSISPNTNTGASQSGTSDETNTTVRVPVAILDNLMAMMSEMVLVRNQVLQISSSSDDLDFLNLSQRLDIVTSELQSEVMKTRMQPIGLVLSKFQRVVRDIAKDLNKRIDLVLEGTETELDKSLIEAIKDPLTHIVRNSCDHGLETPEERRQAGKADNGQITIRSFHEGGQVIIEISDNGRGLNAEKLIKKALEKGIITQEKASKLTEREAQQLIFAAGFSTAAAVTNLSGRGVGMDVVKTNIEKIGGRVELQSEFGKGMTISLKIPLTLAIVPAMIIKCGSEKYAIPQVKLVELVRVENTSDEKEKIEYVQGKPVLRLRGKLLPLVVLNEVLANNQNEKSGYNIVVLNADNRFFGLVVDEIHDTADIVVKPMSRFLKNLSVYSGATILGDGSVSLILDVLGLAKHAHLNAARLDSDEEVSINSTTIVTDQQEFLFCTVGSNTVHGLPLAVVHRLEEFEWKKIQMSGKIPVVEYRNEILPILSLSEYLGYEDFNIQKLSDRYPTCKTLVIKNNNKLFALQVHEILDVVSTTTGIDDAFSDREGLLGSLLVNNEVSVIIDAYQCVEHLMKKMAPNAEKLNIVYSEEYKKNKTVKPSDLHNARILLAEDSNFFKRHITNILKKNNLNVIVANNGAEALDMLSREHFDLVLSDIEMPVMTGIDLAKAIRRQKQFDKLPLIAITTKYSEQYVREGIEAGFQEYLEKIKEVELVEKITEYLTQSILSQRNEVAV